MVWMMLSIQPWHGEKQPSIWLLAALTIASHFRVVIRSCLFLSCSASLPAKQPPACGFALTGCAWPVTLNGAKDGLPRHPLFRSRPSFAVLPFQPAKHVLSRSAVDRAFSPFALLTNISKICPVRCVLSSVCTFRFTRKHNAH